MSCGKRQFCGIESDSKWADVGGLLLPGTRVASGPGLLPRAVSESVILHQPESVLTVMVHLVTKATGMPRGLSCYLWPFWCLRVMLPLGPY